MNRSFRMMIHLAAAAALPALAAAPVQAGFLDNIYTEGHADVTVQYDGTGTEFTHGYLFEGGTVNGVELDETFIESTDVTTLVPESSSAPRPAGAAWDPTGAAAGETIFLLPASEVAGVPFMGWGAEEISAADFPDGILFELMDVSGPGEFSAWGFPPAGGDPNFVMSSASSDPDDNEGIELATGSHTHFNVGFTELGAYNVQFRVTGINTNVSSVGTYRFAVGAAALIPEPSSLALVGLGAGTLLLVGSFRRRRQPKTETV